MTNRAIENCPPEILEWIAWYPDGLSGDQRGAVEGHAATCSACREEIAVLTGRVEAAVAPADPELLFERVLALVEEDGLEATAGVSAPPAPAAPLAPRTAQRPARRPRALRSLGGARLAAGVALLVVGAGLGGWLGREWVAQRAIYAPASAETPLASEGSLALDVVFRSDATAERIQTALRGLGAEVVAGPSPLGRYRVELPPGADASAAAALLRAEGTGVASFAEPLRP
jgi:hypothetical protein